MILNFISCGVFLVVALFPIGISGCFVGFLVRICLAIVLAAVGTSVFLTGLLVRNFLVVVLIDISMHGFEGAECFSCY